MRNLQLVLLLAAAAFSGGCTTYTIRTGDIRETISSGFRGFPMATLTVRNNSERKVWLDAHLGRPTETTLQPPTEVAPGERFVVEARRTLLRSGTCYRVRVGAVAAASDSMSVRAAVGSWNFCDRSRSSRNEVWYVEESGNRLRFRR